MLNNRLCLCGWFSLSGILGAYRELNHSAQNNLHVFLKSGPNAQMFCQEPNLKKIVTKYLQKKPNLIKIVEKVILLKGWDTVHIYKWDEDYIWSTNTLSSIKLVVITHESAEIWRVGQRRKLGIKTGTNMSCEWKIQIFLARSTVFFLWNSFMILTSTFKCH